MMRAIEAVMRRMPQHATDPLKGDIIMATFADLISQAESALASKRALSDAFNTERKALLTPLAATDSLDADGQARFDKLTADKRAADDEITALDSKLTNLRAEAADDEKATCAAAVSVPAAERVAAAVVTKEERTYNKGNMGSRSFFTDAWAAERGDMSARTRIERHSTEVVVEGEQRAGSTGGFAGLVPPVYLVDEYALLARAGRPTANVVQHMALPADGMSIIIPRGTTGNSAAVQATENSAVSNTDEVWANLTVPVVTIAGQNDVSRQSLERGIGIDQIVFNDLYGAYNVALDQQVLYGTGTGGQMLGILATAGVGTATVFAAAVTSATFYTKLTGALNQVETGRFLAPNVIIVHPRRWNWLLGQVDSQGRPLVVPNLNGPFNALGVTAEPQDPANTVPSGFILGVPVITDANIPTTVGTAAEDQVIVARKEDLYLWENGDGSPFQLRFEQTLGNQLTVKLVAYNYAAFTAGRYPAATALIGGTSAAGFGLIAPTF
jgi:HK97 family phage major capsid protein